MEFSTLSGCSSLSSISIPASLLNFNPNFLDTCSSLTEITVAEAHPSLLTIDGVLYSKIPFHLILYPQARAPETFITPASLAGIGYRAFNQVRHLRTLLVTPGVQQLGYEMLLSAIGPQRVFLLGNAPENSWAFQSGAPSTTRFFRLAQAQNFGAGGWPSVSFNVLSSTPSRVLWLVDRNFAPETDMMTGSAPHAEPLLLHYALNIDPVPGTSPMPEFSFDEGQLQLRFFSGRDDIGYVVEASDDLRTWHVDGLVISEEDEQHYRTARLPVGLGKKFLRVRIVP